MILINHSIVFVGSIFVWLVWSVGAVIPQITLLNRRIGQSRGHQTVLECKITAYPQSNNYWEKSGRSISSSSKYKIEPFVESENTLILSLRYATYAMLQANTIAERDLETNI